MAKKPTTSTGAGSYDPAKGGKFSPTTKAPKQPKPHAGHGHKGKS